MFRIITECTDNFTSFRFRDLYIDIYPNTVVISHVRFYMHDALVLPRP